MADDPHQLYALMPPEDWDNWEEPVTSEPDRSGDPATTVPTDSKAGEVAATASARAQRPWNKTNWRVFGLISLVIAVAVVVGIVASRGSDDSSSTPSGGVGKSAASANKATPKESKQGRPASIGQTGGLPLQDGDWRVDSITVASDSHGDFVGSASITYTGEDPEGGDHLFTVTLRKDGEDVGTLQGKVDEVKRGDGATVQLSSSDPWVEGPYTYDL